MSDSKLLINNVEYMYEYKKLDENIEFFCFRCGKRKISKSMLRFRWMDRPRKSAMAVMDSYYRYRGSNMENE